MSPPRTCECMTCPKCRDREWARNRYRLKAYGRWNPNGDVEAVRNHINTLRDNGVGINTISRVSGTSRSRIQRIAYGQAARVGRELADAILAVTAEDTIRIPPYRASRRIRALNAIGYSTRDIANRLGLTQEAVTDIAGERRKWVRQETFEAVAALYEQLCMTPGPNLASRRIARAKGVPGPLAWDNIDDPTEKPRGMAHEGVGDLSDAARVERILAGDWKMPCTPGEKTAVCEAWVARGYGSLTDLERLTGWRVSRYYRKRDAA